MATTRLRQGMSIHKAQTFSRSDGETYLVNFMAIPDVVLGLHAYSCDIARLAHTSFPPLMLSLFALRPQVPALERAQPPLVCQVAMPWSRPGGEGWRASKSS